MDEATSVPLHRWLSLCRLLMLFHPRVGASLYSLHVYGSADARPGWNAIHPAKGSNTPLRYMWVGDEKGKLTETRPDVPDDQISHIYEDALPMLEDSVAWRRTQGLAALVAEKELGGISGERVAWVMDRICEVAKSPLRGSDSLVNHRIEQAIATMKRVASAAEVSLSDFIGPARAAVLECLRYDVTVTQASNILAVLLRQYAGIPAPLDDTPQIERIRASADHLIDCAVALTRQRMGMNLTSFYEATYLALLYGNTALLLLRQTATQLPEGSKEHALFARKGLYIDEHMAHELSPSLIHPIHLAPSSMDESFSAQRIRFSDQAGIYPGVGDQAVEPYAHAQLWDRIQAYSAQADDVDLAATIDEEYGPLHQEEAKRLMMFLQAMMIGNAARNGTSPRI